MKDEDYVDIMWKMHDDRHTAAELELFLEFFKCLEPEDKRQVLIHLIPAHNEPLTIKLLELLGNDADSVINNKICYTLINYAIQIQCKDAILYKMIELGGDIFKQDENLFTTIIWTHDLRNYYLGLEPDNKDSGFFDYLISKGLDINNGVGNGIPDNEENNVLLNALEQLADDNIIEKLLVAGARLPNVLSQDTKTWLLREFIENEDGDNIISVYLKEQLQITNKK